ncbi:MAG: zf-HC2 domain-containing protein, partial [Anaerolineales bacterium]|nr:zf-HC2 domain-containing protein [Anaerolineales bacterium]
YLDQALEFSSVQTLQEHLETCPECQATLSRLEVAITHLENLPEFSLDKDLSGFVLSQLQEDKKLSRGITWTLVAEALVGSAVLGLLIPIFQAAAWMPRLLDTRQKILAGVNIFITQLASNWLVWWAQTQLSFSQLIKPLQSQINLPASLPSPWILILAAGGVAILVNYFLLRTNPQGNQNHN